MKVLFLYAFIVYYKHYGYGHYIFLLFYIRCKNIFFEL